MLIFLHTNDLESSR